MHWPSILAPLLAPNFLVTVLVIFCATALLALHLIDQALWWTAVAGAGAIYTMRGVNVDGDVIAKRSKTP